MKVSFVLFYYIFVLSLLQCSAIVLNSDNVKHEERTKREYYADEVQNTRSKSTSDGFGSIMEDGFLTSVNKIQASQLGKLETVDNRRLSFKKDKPTLNDTPADSSVNMIRSTRGINERFDDGGEKTGDSILYNSQTIHLTSGSINSLHGKFNHGVFIKDIHKTLVPKKVEMNPDDIKSQHVNNKGQIGNEAKDMNKHPDVEIHDGSYYVNLEDFFFGYDLIKSTKEKQSADKEGLQTPINNNNQKHVESKQHLQDNFMSLNDINSFTAGKELTFSVDLNNDFTESEVTGANSLIQDYVKIDLPAKSSLSSKTGTKSKHNINQGDGHDKAGILSKAFIKPFTVGKELTFSVDLINDLTEFRATGANANSLNHNIDKKDLPFKYSKNGAKDIFNINQGNDHEMSEILSQEILKPFTAHKELIFSIDLNNDFTESGVIGSNSLNQNNKKDLPSMVLQNGVTGDKSKFLNDQGNDHEMMDILSKENINPFTVGKELTFSVDLNKDFKESGMIGDAIPLKHSDGFQSLTPENLNLRKATNIGRIQDSLLTENMTRYKTVTSDNETPDPMGWNSGFLRTEQIGRNTLGLGNSLQDTIIIDQGMHKADNRNLPASRSFNSRMVDMSRSDFWNMGDVRMGTTSYETNRHGGPSILILRGLQINAPTKESWTGNTVGIERISPDQTIDGEIRREFGRHQPVLDSESRNENRQPVSFPFNRFNGRLLDPQLSTSTFGSHISGPITDFSSLSTGNIDIGATVSGGQMIQPPGYRKLFRDTTSTRNAVPGQTFLSTSLPTRLTRILAGSGGLPLTSISDTGAQIGFPGLVLFFN